MERFIKALALCLLFNSCKEDKRPVVKESVIDSLLRHYQPRKAQKALQAELLFWKQRIDPAAPGLVSELRYASCLVQRFQLLGDIQDLYTADKLLRSTDSFYHQKEPGVGMALIRNYLLLHRFAEADSLLDEVKKRNLKPYDAASLGFDVAFERGQYLLAENELRKMINANDYGYLFRKAKMAHYRGALDTALEAMEQAAILAGNNSLLKQAALSNAADLSLHNDDPVRAYGLYIRSLESGLADLHSLMGIGWIALTHDHNDSLAGRIFRFVETHTQAPDVLLKLEQVAESRGDLETGKRYARSFEQIVTRPAYGNMYNKYLLELYTGILNEPGKAEFIAQQELNNRNTPQTRAWYVYSLFRNQKMEEALEQYDRYVSGKPLEALELYWMGSYMEGIGKRYNAQQFYKSAYKNRYDLSIRTQEILKQKLK